MRYPLLRPVAAHAGRLLPTLALLAALSAPAQAQTATLRGTVTDAGTREAIPGATVFLAGTQRGTVTDAEGRFLLAALPAGPFDAVVTMPGYRLRQQPLVLVAGDTLTLDVSLALADLRLPGLVVEDDGRAWRRNLAEFRTAFLGTVPHARQCQIVNERVLVFGRTRDGLTARSTEPLVIENRALGYRLSYALDDFEHQPHTGLVRWRGGAYFTPLPPRDAREQRRWDVARQETYRGSLAHFLRALAAGTYVREGFRVYQTPTLGLDVNTLGQVLTQEATPAAFLSPGAAPGTFTLGFTGFLQVLYRHEAPHPDYAASQDRIAQRFRVSGQHSALELRAPVASFQASGLLLDPYASTSWGYWAWENRVSTMLPFEYADAGG